MQFFLLVVMNRPITIPLTLHFIITVLKVWEVMEVVLAHGKVASKGVSAPYQLHKNIFMEWYSYILKLFLVFEMTTHK